jgi:hypothetical protein
MENAIPTLEHASSKRRRISRESSFTGIVNLRKTSGAKAEQFIAEYRRHKCLLHPVMLYIHAENV